MLDNLRLHRPHLRSSPLPEPSTAYRPRQQRRFPRRGTDPGHARSVWNPYGLHISPPVNLRDLDNGQRGPRSDARAQPPPYPTTPPPRLNVPVVPTLGYRAPSPVPESSIPEQKTTQPDPEPDRLQSLKRNCLHKLDVSLKQLTYAAITTGAVQFVALGFFIRFEKTGKPSTPAGIKAVLVFWALSLTVFALFFSLIMGVLCRRSKYTRLNRAAQKTEVNGEIELHNLAQLIARKFGINSRDTERWVRRHAVSGVRDAEEGYTVFGAWPARPHRSRYDPGRIIHRPNGLPLRVASAPLPSARFTAALATASSSEEGLMQPISRLASDDSVSSWGSQAAEASSASHDISLDMSILSTRAQASPNISPVNHVSPKSQARPENVCHSETTAPSARAFEQHMNTSGSRELRAYLEMSSASSAAVVGRSSITEDNHANTDADDDQKIDVEIDERRSEEVQQASVVSVRKAGKARIYSVGASPRPSAEPQARVSPTRSLKKPSGLSKASKMPQRRGSNLQETSPNKSLEPLAQRREGNISMNSPATKVDRSQSSSPQKLTGKNSKAVGLGISIIDKENLAPEGSSRNGRV